LVALEAIARGVPVIASRSGGLSEVVEDGRSGLLFPNGDEGALRESMLAIAQGRAFGERILAPEVILHAMKRHSLDAHVKKLRQTLVEVSSSVLGN
jgi:glycosyltransferase involved in cell wall biosynthesis